MIPRFPDKIQAVQASITQHGFVFNIAQCLPEEVLYSEKEEDTILHTAGLHHMDEPEIIFLLGPRHGERHHQVTASNLLNDVIRTVRGEQIEKILSERVSVLSVGDEYRRRHYKRRHFATIQEEETFKETYLVDLTHILETPQYGIIVFEPGFWVS
jgi:3-deoxy-D-manno-octulosonic-acid transferase